MYKIDLKRAVKIENKIKPILAELEKKTADRLVDYTINESKESGADAISSEVDSLAKNILDVLTTNGIKVKTPKVGYNKMGDGNVLFCFEFVSRGEFVSERFVLNSGRIFKYPDYYNGKDAWISIGQLPELFEEKIKELRYDSEHIAWINERLRKLHEGKSPGRHSPDDFYREVNNAAEKIANMPGGDLVLTAPPKVTNVFSESGVIKFRMELRINDKYVTESFAVTKECHILHRDGEKVNLEKIHDFFRKKIEKIECRSSGHVSHSAAGIKTREVKPKADDAGFSPAGIPSGVNALAKDIVKALTENGIEVEKPARGYKILGDGTVLFGLEFISGSEFVSEWFVIRGINNVFFPWPDYYLKPGIKGILTGDMPKFFREKIGKKPGVNSTNSENNKFTIAGTGQGGIGPGMLKPTEFNHNSGKIALETDM
jgi:hypothetical protein